MITSEEQALIQLIVFVAGNEEFAVPIDAVREIIKMGAITPIPSSPDFIKGIINVRGEIVTTIDINSRFALSSDNSDAKHIIVTKQEKGLFGLIVDEVVEVLRVSNKDIQPPPTIVTEINQKYIAGVLTHHNRLIILLDLPAVISESHNKKIDKQGKNL